MLPTAVQLPTKNVIQELQYFHIYHHPTHEHPDLLQRPGLEWKGLIPLVTCSSWQTRRNVATESYPYESDSRTTITTVCV